MRRGAKTVEELARELGLTDNAIRSHLTTLERDGLVRQQGVRRGPGAGKPAIIYELHPMSAALFTRAYEPVLRALLDEMSVQLPIDESASFMRAIGRRLASTLPAGMRAASRPSSTESSPDGMPAAHARLAAAALDVLGALGGEAMIESESDHSTIRGCAECPLGNVITTHPELCQAMESLLVEATGASVKSVCRHGERPRCGFEIRAVA
jgi:predicted ArsR family transcriptional regulator